MDRASKAQTRKKVGTIKADASVMDRPGTIKPSPPIERVMVDGWLMVPASVAVSGAAAAWARRSDSAIGLPAGLAARPSPGVNATVGGKRGSLAARSGFGTPTFTGDGRGALSDSRPRLPGPPLPPQEAASHCRGMAYAIPGILLLLDRRPLIARFSGPLGRKSRSRRSRGDSATYYCAAGCALRDPEAPRGRRGGPPEAETVTTKATFCTQRRATPRPAWRAIGASS